jgi:hypothetical protein
LSECRGTRSPLLALYVESQYEQIDRMLAKSEDLVGAYSHADIAFHRAQLFAEIVGVPLSSTTLMRSPGGTACWRAGPVQQVTAAARHLPWPRNGCRYPASRASDRGRRTLDAD